MTQVHQPRDAADIADLVRQAGARGSVLEVRAGASKSAYGGWTRAHEVMDVSALSGVIDYDPAELVLTAWAGTPLAQIEALVQASGQMLAFEPYDHGPYFGAAAGRATLGGTIAANVSGPRRLSHGAARDHLLGFEAVTGAGDVFKAGGKVVKNVTGFDLSKLMCGSWGSLAVLTQATVKVLPAGRESASLVLEGLAGSEALAVMTAALQAPAEVSGAAYLPGTAEERSIAALRLEGFGPSVAARAEMLRQMLQSMLQHFGAAIMLEAEQSRTFWADVAAGAHLPSQGALWRISAPPAQGAKVADALQACGMKWSLDWGGGLIWAAAPLGDGSMERRVREAAAQAGGHATLVRAPAGAGPVQAFPDEPRAVQALTGRIKAAFDPHGVLADRRKVLAREPA
jgi:glycolate oxidase FAD binding subunit